MPVSRTTAQKQAPLPEVADRGDADHEGGHERVDGHGQVQVEDLLDRPHRDLDGRVDPEHDEAADEERQRPNPVRQANDS
jgi:hypothetical protein